MALAPSADKPASQMETPTKEVREVPPEGLGRGEQPSHLYDPAAVTEHTSFE